MKTTATLADFNPALATELGLPLATDPQLAREAATDDAEIAAWNAGSATPEALGAAALAGAGLTEQAPKAVKIDAAKVDPTLLALFENLASRAVAEKITATAAVSLVMQAHPTATRVAIKHTAALVGINPLTARNTFDRNHK